MVIQSGSAALKSTQNNENYNHNLVVSSSKANSYNESKFYSPFVHSRNVSHEDEFASISKL